MTRSSPPLRQAVLADRPARLPLATRIAPSRAMAGWFLLLVVPLCLYLAAVVPVGQAPDEPSHALRAYSLLRGDIIGSRDLVTYDGAPHLGAGVVADPVLVWVQQVLPTTEAVPGRLDPEVLARVKGYGWTRAVFVQIGTIATYFPIFYLPEAAAIGVGRALGATPYQAVVAARFVNAIAYCVLALAALLLARSGRIVLFAVLALPMTVYLAASLNQDALIVAGTALAVALLTRAGQAHGDFTRVTAHPAYRLAALLLALVILAKPPYLPLAAMLLLPLPRPSDWSRMRGVLTQRLLLAVLVVLPAMLWSWYAMRYVAAPVPRPTYAPGPLWPGDPALSFTGTDPGAQLTVLLAHPLRLLAIPWHALAQDRDLLFTSFIGKLGWLKLDLPDWLYWLWSLGLAAACAAELLNGAARPRPAPLLDMAFILLAAAATLLAVLLSQYLTWTNVGDVMIGGLQGRYLLPIAPALALALAGALRGPPVLRAGAAALPVLAAAAGLLALPMLINAVYYGS